MAKPKIIQWPDDEQDIDDIETRLNNMRTNTDPQSPGFQPPMHFEGYRSRGSRGFLGGFGDQANIGFLVGSGSNPAGNPPKSNPIVKSDDLTLGIDEGRFVSIDFGVTESGGPQPPNNGRWNATPVWPDITRGYWDQRMIDMLGEANFRTLVTSGTTGHPIEIPRSEANIKQGMGGFQPNSATSQNGNTRYNELHDVCRYIRRFVEGAGPGASGLVNPYPVDPGVLDWTLSLGGNMFKHVAGGPFVDEWSDGLQGVIDTLGADAYYNSASQDEPTFQQMFQPCLELANELGFAFCIPEHGVNGNNVTAAFKGNWYRAGFAWLATIPHDKLKWINWTYFSTNKYDQPGGFGGDAFRGFFDGWQAFLLAPDPGGEPPPPPPPPPGFVPGVVAPMRRSIMAGS